jgi:hypothetical protein
MDKVNFVIASKEVITLTFKKDDILILPYIPQSVKLDLAKQYISFMFSSNNIVDNYYCAEWGLILGILKECTNIETSQDNFNDIISSGLWDQVKSKIENYDEFRNDLKEIFKNESEKRISEKSLGQVLDKVSNGILEFLNKIGEVDLSQEGVANLVEKLNTVTNDIEQKFPGAINKVKKPRKKRETPKIE